MSKVCEYYTEMEELYNEVDYLAHIAEEERLAQSEVYGMDNMEDNKAQEFARKVAVA